jgi:hypothetical protein
MTPDPAIDWLAGLTPNASGLDPAEVLVRAGRASARTPRGWKLAVAGLLLANVATLVILLPHRGPPSEVAPAPVATPVPAPAPAPPPESPPGSDANSVAALARSFDPDAPPPPAGFVAPDRPADTLTVGSHGVTD